VKGDFVGIGLIYMYKDSVAIIRPIENGPSKQNMAGIEFYMLIKKLFGRKLPSDSLFSKLKGVL
jgi:carboxyl-terminal processing protease